ncbi:MAG TPA: RhuM family protein [Kofleriaceae bacterium]
MRVAGLAMPRRRAAEARRRRELLRRAARTDPRHPFLREDVLAQGAGHLRDQHRLRSARRGFPAVLRDGAEQDALGGARHTAAEIIAGRADATRPNMGMTSWSGDMPRKADALVAKNYLGADEIEALNRIVTAYLEFAELQAIDRKPMYMADWIAKLDDFLKLSDREILNHAGRISHEAAVAKAELEYDNFAAARAALPAPAERHFEQVTREVKQLEKAQRTARASTTGRARKKP